ncbi:MAG: hypothetical protein KC443_10160 [Anaerolineales bacterium]|nr:hypothetical protein [Anaerolineales bacterium]
MTGFVVMACRWMGGVAAPEVVAAVRGAVGVAVEDGLVAGRPAAGADGRAAGCLGVEEGDRLSLRASLAVVVGASAAAMARCTAVAVAVVVVVVVVGFNHELNSVLDT